MCTENKGVQVSSVENAKEVLLENKPDIAIITTMSLIKRCKGCINNMY